MERMRVRCTTIDRLIRCVRSQLEPIGNAALARTQSMVAYPLKRVETAAIKPPATTNLAAKKGTA
jgi:hypothetical protein